MAQGQTKGIRPPLFLRCEERAADAIAAVTLYATIPSTRKTFWRKARCKHEQPSALARLLGSLFELASYGVPEATLRRFETTVRETIDALFTGVERPALDVAALRRETDLEHTENTFAIRYLGGERTREVVTGFRDALRAENEQQQVMIRALDSELRGLRA